ncbi:hypothetical protein GCM10027062_08370 [Nocardioides hungaricus]
MERAITEDRVAGIRSLLWAAIACAALLLLVAAWAATNDSGRYAVTLTVAAVVLVAVAGYSLHALRARDARARRGAIATGVLMIVLGVPAVQVWIGVVMAIAGLGLLFVILNREAER